MHILHGLWFSVQVSIIGGSQRWWTLFNEFHTLTCLYSHCVEGWLFWETSTEIKQTHNNKPQSELSFNTGQPNLDVLSEAQKNVGKHSFSALWSGRTFINYAKLPSWSIVPGAQVSANISFQAKFVSLSLCLFLAFFYDEITFVRIIQHFE